MQAYYRLICMMQLSGHFQTTFKDVFAPIILMHTAYQRFYNIMLFIIYIYIYYIYIIYLFMYICYEIVQIV